MNVQALPILPTLRGYKRSWLAADVVAGLTLVAIAIPEQMATAHLANMPAVAGFYAFVAGSLLFALIGRHPRMSVGADSTIAPVFAAGVATVAAVGTPAYTHLVSATSMDLCALTDTLIADGDGLYHPADFNDRLVLGLKGTMSEAELHLIRHRLTAGLLHKAAKGELRQGLPVGYDYDEVDAVVMSPDEAVREAIATVFRRFEELCSARQVMLSMYGDGLLLPRRDNGPVWSAGPSRHIGPSTTS